MSWQQFVQSSYLSIPLSHFFPIAVAFVSVVVVVVHVVVNSSVVDVFT